MANCNAAMRPFPTGNETEIRCELEGEHDRHMGTLRDYAYKGSKTKMEWQELDRRTFHGEWPGYCSLREDCVLPDGHRGNHAQ